MKSLLHGKTKKRTTSKKRRVIVEALGQAHIHSSFNNIIITFTNNRGDVICWSSAGKMGFRGSKKNTPYAAQTTSKDCSKTAFDLGIRKVKVLVKGPGTGREAAMRAISTNGIEISEIVDATPIPHNGCRPPNKRRV